MASLPSLTEMLKAGVHFGHKTSKRHPRMAPYIYLQRGGVHIIDLAKTSEMLEKALKRVSEVAEKGGTLLLVGTKKQAKSTIEAVGKEHGIAYICNRWPGGMITNFREIHKVIKKYRDMKQKQASGEYQKYTKKEQSGFAREIERLEKIVGGISQLDALPSLVFLTDIRTDQTAVSECMAKKVEMIALTDTNTDPDKIEHPIPCNDDAKKAIEMMTSLIAKVFGEGRRKYLQAQAAPASAK